MHIEDTVAQMKSAAGATTAKEDVPTLLQAIAEHKLWFKTMIIGWSAADSSNLSKVFVLFAVGQNVMDTTKQTAMELEMLAFFVDGRAILIFTTESLALQKKVNTLQMGTADGVWVPRMILAVLKITVVAKTVAKTSAKWKRDFTDSFVIVSERNLEV